MEESRILKQDIRKSLFLLLGILIIFAILKYLDVTQGLLS